MASISKRVLSGSTTGKGIKVAATATPGTLIHTADSPTGAVGMDEVWLYASNADASPIKLTLEWGGVAVPDDLIEITIPAESGLYCVAPGLLIQNSLVIRAWAGSANLVEIHGYVNRIVN